MQALSLAELEKEADFAGADGEMAQVRQLDAEGKGEAATDLLKRSAQRGNTAAKTALAQRMIVNPGYFVDEAAFYAVSAANDGGREACYLTAALAGSGIGMPQNWNTSLIFAQRAAELGHEPARKALILLASDRDLAARASASLDSAIWQNLRQSIDLKSWLKPPRTRNVCMSPRVGVIENFLAPEICDWLIEKARPELAPAQTFDRETGGLIYEAGRTNSAAYFHVPAFDLPLLLVRGRMGIATGLPPVTMEAPAVLHYQVGQEFAPHHDYLDIKDPGYAQLVAESGQRILTFLTYLNDDYEGAETDFPMANYRFKGRKGDALFFWNVHPTGAADERSLHAGLSPTRGEKFVLSQWIRGLRDPRG